MHRERIIKGIEKVFESYAQDMDLREALRESNTPFQLFPTNGGECYFLDTTGIFSRYSNVRTLITSRPDIAARAYFDYFRFRSKPPFTLTKAKAMLAEDLGARVEKLKRDYAKHFDNECDRQAERYAQHPAV